MFHKTILFLGLLLVTSGPALAQDATQCTALQSLDKTLAKLSTEHQLTDDITLKAGGQLRYRLESRHNFNFNDATFEDDTFHLVRSRVHVLVGTEHVKVFAQGQDSESFASREAHKSSSFINRMDVHQLYAKLKSPVEELPLTFMIGRQKLAYGDQRYVGGFEWSNVARVFDAIKLIYTPKDWLQLDLFVSRVVPVNKSQPDSANHNENFWGAYLSTKPTDKHTLDTFVFMRHNLNNEIAGEVTGRLGQLKQYTVGNRFKGQCADWDYGFEWAYQSGSRAHETIRAWSLHSALGYTFKDCTLTPRFSVEYNHGSGDSNPTDGTIENFDNLFPTNHLHYGYMDFFSLRNLNNIKVGLDLKPKQNMKVNLAYHFFGLANSQSAWFNAGQGTVRASNGAASETVGHELDLTFKWKLSKHLDLLMGYSHFFAGAHVEDTGASDDADFFYFQPTITF